MKDSNKKGQVYRISTSPRKGMKKRNVHDVVINANTGIEGDAHGGTERQISLLPFESFKKVEHPELNVRPGDFAENITTVAVDFSRLTLGRQIKIGDSVRVEIIQIGTECHKGCIIREKVGDCIMPREGVFGKVLVGGKISQGDPVEIIN
jgi:MOSC domain-containing protein YiiM